MAKFTFRKVKHTGRYRSFELDQTTIKLDRKEVGYMCESRDDQFWRIRLAVKKEPTKQDPADFKWVMLEARPESEQQGREFILKYAAQILERYDLYQFDD